jgi:hypothetical protein
MSNQPANPQEEIRDKISSLQSDFNSMQDDIRLNDLRKEVEDLSTAVRTLSTRFTALRAQGYPFEKSLEEKIADLQKRWSAQQPAVSLEIANQGAMLVAAAAPLEYQMNQLASYASNIGMANTLIPQAEASIHTLDSKVDAAKANLRSVFQAFVDEKNTIASHLEDLEWSYGQLGEASFRLLPTESLIMAVKAVWVRDGSEDKDDPKGILFLSDQRLMFEQKQEVATKKVLFITTEKKKVQERIFESAVETFKAVTATKRGFMSHEDHVEIMYNPGAPQNYTHFHIDGQDCNAWNEMLNCAVTHYFDVDRAIPIPEEVVEKVKSAPAQCPTCGGAITQPVLRGMDSINCPYCGLVIRL